MHARPQIQMFENTILLIKFWQSILEMFQRWLWNIHFSYNSFTINDVLYNRSVLHISIIIMDCITKWSFY